MVSKSLGRTPLPSVAPSCGACDLVHAGDRATCSVGAWFCEQIGVGIGIGVGTRIGVGIGYRHGYRSRYGYRFRFRKRYV